MKRFVITVLMSAAVAGSLSAAEIVESVIARVGDRIITRTQYAERLRQGFEEIEQTFPPDEVAEKKAELKKSLLETMLSELLLKDRADRLGLTVNPKELEEAVERLKDQYGIKTDEEFNESLRKSGMTRAEMESRLRDTLLTNKVFSRELRSRAELTERELRQRYEQEKEQYRLPERAHIREIVIIPPENGSESDAASRAANVAEQAKSGVDFEKLVSEYSGAPSKDHAGDLGVVAKGELLTELDAAVFNAPAGTVVGPIRTKAGFHIMKIEERLPSEIQGFDAVKDKLRRQVDDETFQRDYKAYIEGLRKEAFIQVNEDQIPSL